MNIVILGAGEIGRHLTVRLSEEGHDVQVIEQDETITTQLEQSIDAKVIRGDGSLAGTLTSARVSQCELFVACTTHNNTNLVASALAKELGAAKSICRVHPSVEKDEFLINRRHFFHIDHLFSTERLTVIEIAKTIRNPESMLVEDIAQGRIELQQVKVSPGSEAAGKSLLDLKLPNHLRVATISRGDQHIVPTAADIVQGGDILTLFGPPRGVQEFARSLGKRMRAAEDGSVVIMGGGQYGSELARVLQGSKLKSRIFEKNLQRCEELMATFGRDATIINADATDLAALREEQVGDANFFVATLADDADNVMACLQASDLGTQHTLTLLHRADFATAIQHFSQQIGIDLAISPREASLKYLQRFITSDRYHILRSLDAGEVLEASVPEGSGLAGKEVKDIDLPDGCVLVGHIHNVHAEVPGADTVLQPGDNVIAMVSHKAKKRFVKLLGK